MQKLLTIVVPVYKVEQYINKCLDSCILYREDGSLDEEKMPQLEVIIVNDGTPDRSAELSREYTVRYPQTFRQIDKENGGHGSAWNVGLKEATGTYLRFLDSDDWLTNLDKLMEKLAETDADLVFTYRNRYYVEDRRNEVDEISDEYGLTKPLSEFNFVKNSSPYLPDFWFVTYKKSVLEFGHPIFMEHTFYDDSILYLLPFAKAKTYVCLDFVVYNYLLGRVGQTMDPEVERRNALMGIRVMMNTLDFWDANKPHDLPENVGTYIYKLLSFFLGYEFQYLHKLPYQESKRVHQRYSKYMDETVWGGKVLKRYKKYPFCIYYTLETIRNSKLYRGLRK